MKKTHASLMIRAALAVSGLPSAPDLSATDIKLNTGAPAGGSVHGYRLKDTNMGGSTFIGEMGITWIPSDNELERAAPD